MSRIFKQFKPREHSKSQQNKKEKSYNCLACNNCHRSDITLIKAKDSYYCKFCFEKLGKEKY